MQVFRGWIAIAFCLATPSLAALGANPGGLAVTGGSLQPTPSAAQKESGRTTADVLREAGFQQLPQWIENPSKTCCEYFMKLSDWAKTQGVTYRKAWNWYKEGRLPMPAKKLPSGTIVVEVDKHAKVAACEADQ